MLFLATRRNTPLLLLLLLLLLPLFSSKGPGALRCPSCARPRLRGPRRAPGCGGRVPLVPRAQAFGPRRPRALWGGSRGALRFVSPISFYEQSFMCPFFHAFFSPGRAGMSTAAPTALSPQLKITNLTPHSSHSPSHPHRHISLFLLFLTRVRRWTGAMRRGWCSSRPLASRPASQGLTTPWACSTPAGDTRTP